LRFLFFFFPLKRARSFFEAFTGLFDAWKTPSTTVKGNAGVTGVPSFFFHDPGAVLFFNSGQWFFCEVGVRLPLFFPPFPLFALGPPTPMQISFVGNDVGWCLCGFSQRGKAPPPPRVRVAAVRHIDPLFFLSLMDPSQSAQNFQFLPPPFFARVVCHCASSPALHLLSQPLFSILASPCPIQLNGENFLSFFFPTARNSNLVGAHLPLFSFPPPPLRITLSTTCFFSFFFLRFFPLLKGGWGACWCLGSPLVGILRQIQERVIYLPQTCVDPLPPPLFLCTLSAFCFWFFSDSSTKCADSFLNFFSSSPRDPLYPNIPLFSQPF